MFEELKDYIASHTKEEIQEDWKETPEFESGMISTIPSRTT